VDGIDLIVGGHSHTVLLKPSEARNPSDQRVLIVQTGAYSQYLGRLDLTVNPSARPRITDYKGPLIALDKTVADDPQMKAIVDKWQAQLPPPAVVGQMTVDLDMTIRGREAPAGDLFCDAMLDYCADLPDPAQRPVVAIYNAGGLRGGKIFPAGPVTTEDIATWEQFGNTIILMDLTAPQLKEVLESGAKGPVMQVAGLAYWIDNIKPAQEADDTAKKITKPGQRIVRITIGGQDIDLSDASKVYRVATNNFLAGGGDACYTFLEGKNSLNTEVYMTDILESYIRKHSPIAPKVEGRITFGSR
jgi:2',3'-cyclic-nucleotide 2'-phosphodiesterase (5'-nucleotidase family)